jgi:hypothetical protein
MCPNGNFQEAATGSNHISPELWTETSTNIDFLDRTILVDVEPSHSFIVSIFEADRYNIFLVAGVVV